MKRLLTILILLLAGSTSIYAQEQSFKQITADEIMSMKDSKASFMLIDARTEQEFAQGHITGSINISPDKVPYIAGFLPKNKKTPLIIYCRGFS